PAAAWHPGAARRGGAPPRPGRGLSSRLPPSGGRIRPERSSTMNSSKKPAVVRLGTALAGGLLLSGSSFAVTPLAQGYMAGAPEAAAAKAQEGSCGGDKAKAGEGKCGLDRVDTDKDGKVSRAEFDAIHPDEGEKFTAMDANGDGFVD